MGMACFMVHIPMFIVLGDLIIESGLLHLKFGIDFRLTVCLAIQCIVFVTESIWYQIADIRVCSD